MKKNIYYIITAWIIIAFSIYNIIFVQELITSTINSLKEITNGMEINYFNKVISVYEHSGERIIITSSIISIIASLGIIILSVKDALGKYKGLSLFLTVLIFITATNNIISIIAAINFILLVNIKTIKKEKKNIPQIVYESATIKKKIFALFLLFFYFSQLIWADYIPDNYLIYWAIVILFDLSIFVLAIIAFFQEIRDGFNYFKNNILVYIKYLLAKYGKGLLIYFITNIIVVMITNQETSVNQSILKTLPLWYIIPSTIIWAPVVEEILFRGAIRRFITNDKVFIVVSALIFGFLHAMNEATILNMVVTTIPYAVLGGLLAYIYVKTNNILCNMLVHSFHNSIAITIMLLTL